MFCSRCRRPAVIYQRYSGLHLCRTHFEADFEAKAKRAIRVHRWLSPGDRIGVMLNGGRDSALLSFLQKLIGRRRDVGLLGITIDMGIAGYSNTSIVRSFAEKRGVRIVAASFREMFGVTFDEMPSLKNSGQSCSSCSSLRALCLEKVAREHGITRLAISVNLNEEAQRVFSNVLTGDVERLIHPRVPPGGLGEHMRPFMYIPEREVALYASYHAEGLGSMRCRYASGRSPPDIKSFLDRYDQNHPSTLYALVNLADRLRGLGEAGMSHERDDCHGWDEPVTVPCSICRLPDEVADA
jgi:tRNA(Ile)-lysidine synthase TilS/MesJ